jgi:ornithine carbamoyltransferase
MTHPKHFLDLDQFGADELTGIIKAARAMKDARRGLDQGQREAGEPLKGKVIGLIFERPSTRTRVSFEVGIRQLGGDVLTLSATEMQLGRSETIADTARVMSRYVDGLMIRAAQHSTMQELAAHATVPVINGLTNETHPCQVMADVMTLEERKGALAQQKIAWVGDGNNVRASWIHAVGVMGGELTIGCPSQLRPAARLLSWAKSKRGTVRVVEDPAEAVRGADCVVTDAWVSMHNDDGERRHNLLKPYQVNARLMSHAKSDALFMHCLPAHRNEEVTDEVMDGKHSVVFDEAENRLHVQKAILLHCLAAA